MKNNNHQIIGYLGKDPEYKEFEGGDTVVKFTVATSNGYYSKEKQEYVNLDSDWHNVTSFKKSIIKTSRNLKKGSKVMVSGPVKTRKYNDLDGNEKYITEIRADILHEHVRRSQDDSGFPEPKKTDWVQPAKAEEKTSIDDDLPF